MKIILPIFLIISTALCEKRNDEFLQPEPTFDDSKPISVKSFPENDIAVLEADDKINDKSLLFHNSGRQLLENDIVFDALENAKAKNEVIFSDLSTAESNKTVVNETISEKNQTAPKIICVPRVLADEEVPSVNITNGTVLLKILTPGPANVTSAECLVILFYSSQCVFSARMAPHFNALARVFPPVTFYALDTAAYNNVHLRFGVVSVPNILLFHNGKAVARFNDTHHNLENFVNFVVKHTGLQYNGTLNVTSADMNGPVPATLTKNMDYVLIVAWVFTIFCLCILFLKSSLCHKIVESIRNTWLEAEAQHEHVD